MLFSRKYPIKIRETISQILRPRYSYATLAKRMALYFWHRLLRLKHHPHQVALGVAIGVFVSFSPFIGMHGPLSVLLAVSLRGSLIAAFLAQGVGNPITFPIIWLSCWKLGCLITGSAAQAVDFTDISLGWIRLHWMDLLNFLLPFSVGGLVLGIGFASISYLLVHGLMARHRAR